MGWYNAAWPYRIPIVIDHDKVPGTATQHSVLVTEANMPAAYWGDVKADASDVVFTTSDGTTKLARDRIVFTPGSSLQQFRVAPFSISDSLDTTFYLYFGNAAGAEAARQAAAYHANAHWFFPMESATPEDYIGNLSSVTLEGGATTGTGKIHTGWSLPLASGSYVKVPDQANAEYPADEFTFTAWVYWNSLASGTVPYLISKSSFSDNKRCLHLVYNVDTGQWSAAVSENGTTSKCIVYWNNSPSTGQWYHYMLAFKASSPVPFKLWIDGSFVSATSVTGSYGGTPYNNDVPLTLGARINGGTPERFLDGVIDDAWMWSNDFSNEAAAIRYNNDYDPSAFYSCGSIENRPTGWPHNINGVANARLGKIISPSLADILKVNEVE